MNAQSKLPRFRPVRIRPPAFFLALLLGAWSPPPASLAAQPFDLRGTVLAEDDSPVTNATVFIYTARPKDGPGVLCPSCYADCRKRTRTDAGGTFTVPELAPGLLFRVLVAAPGFQPKFVPDVDPGNEPLSVRLRPVSETDDPRQRLPGRVTDPAGKPIVGAVIEIRGVTRNGSTRYGGNDDIDPVAVSDEEGNFVIHGASAFDAAGVRVEARGFARRSFAGLRAGGERHELQLTEGASLQGRVLLDGEPLAGAQMGVAGADRGADHFTGDYAVASDAEGRFLFVNLPARTRYQLYGKMESLRDRGTVTARQVRTEDDGSLLDVGDLSVEPSWTVAGRLQLTDGAAPPVPTRVMLSRKDAWDTQQVEADAEGRFRFEGVPSETVHVNARIPDYRLSLRNASLDLLNPFYLSGRVRTNKTDLVLEFEPGRHEGGLGRNSQALDEEPLRGAEPVEESFGDIRITGRAVDAESGLPLPEFTVTEGRLDGHRSIFNWLANRKTTHTNGTFSVGFVNHRFSPGVLVEAKGYVPQSSGAVTVAETNLVFEMRRGEGPRGIVLSPDGQPAIGVKVYLADMRQGIYIDKETMEVRERVYRDTPSVVTDASGAFAFPPDIEAYAVMVADELGYGEVKVETLRTLPRVVLQPWARVEGELRIGPRPGANEFVRLGLAHVPYQHHPRSFPPLSLHLRTATDADGRFVFPRVPPLAVQIAHEPQVRDSRVGTVPESQTQKLLLEPGRTHTVTLGGQGRPVVGRMVVQGYDGDIDWRSEVYSLNTVLPDPPELPDMRAISREYGEAVRDAETEEEKIEAGEVFRRRRDESIEQSRLFYASEAGLRHHFAKQRFVLNFQPDGSFRVEDVPAGTYSLRIDLRESSGQGVSRMSAPKIAGLETEIEVPDSDAAGAGDVYDAGTLVMTAVQSMKPGRKAPDFEVKSLDGESIRLSDFKGRYVLLDFWAVWCGPCVKETPFLKATYEAFKDDARFAMIGLSLDPKISDPRRYVAQNDLGWTQGFLGEWSKTDLPARYGVEGIPAIFLVGPDGKIAATGLRGDIIQAAVRSALGSEESQSSLP